jgi:hypothetical protein
VDELGVRNLRLKQAKKGLSPSSSGTFIRGYPKSWGLVYLENDLFIALLQML